jgi:AraC-like DNA-binding protein
MVGIRPDWMHLLTNKVQGTVGLIQLDDDNGMATARDLVTRIPDPATALEERMLRGILIDVCLLWAVTTHRRAHAGDVPSCAFREETIVHRVWHQRASSWPAKKAFMLWARRHFRALHRAHPAPIRTAADWMVAHSRERVNDNRVAHAVGVHVVALRKGFKATYDLSPHEYLQRVRLADVMQLLASDQHNTGSAWYTAGWRSSKSLYEASVAVTGMPLGQLRVLEREDVDSRVALPRPRTQAVA